MHSRQQEIATALNVCAPFTGPESVQAEIDRRVSFIQTCLRESGLKTLVLGISGGVDSTTAGLLAQRAVAGMREAGEGDDYSFIAVRLPYQVQHDEHEAQLAVDAIKPDECHTVNIGTAVLGLAAATQALDPLSPAQRDFVLGNTKARMRMVAQYTIANARQGLVIGTDHAAEAVMGFFTKFGDGACDLTPLAGLVKDQVRQIAAALGAPDQLVHKVPTADLEELSPGKPDEAAHGVSYRNIDDFLQGKPVPDEAARIIIDTYDKTAHKRQLPKEP
ncbi:ammonia-dependent NAD(+) synthetase [Pseudomonas sp. NP21570]|jgi:NAD+ synthase|uniref:ammonia-dependent NAD(+) synthetase n=1 Tax=Stutzerimonas kunmingensis TaxID=1211807 RepID=UPI0008AB95F3|nr:ammonia-dependent NAD(+) synthetase [Stutzerimonas kunmingensis]MAF88460.1 NAD(+) synthase [Pseudomonas sp.]MCB4794433.1 ammonia-dependent NAD(+) synthetase [Pseudomonas sp. NP21570]OHC13887.1 MAG: NAD(+) synthase [Pseudomonadales bacterium GWC2_63_15]RRU92406.1 ammonia-dependent NAD(+) synthetase [Stutzerimonas xanthomarina]UIP34789.1 ammonia-dependent NAD(+) synthetase [Stutzerimonas kunmingensis]|tara:strand:- start:2073 stop:2900 length:828 start_codon:yes stop_codon:yes gene_type:complete